MAKLTQYTSQATPNVQQAVYASNAMADYSMAPAQGLARVGQSIDAMGQIAESYQRSMDNIRSVEANNLLQTTALEIDQIKEENPNNPEMWDTQIEKKLADFDRKMGVLTKDISSQRRGLIESESMSFRKNTQVRTQIDKAKTAAKIEWGKLSAMYASAVESGNDTMANNAVMEMDRNYNKWFGSAEEYDYAKKNIQETAQRNYEYKLRAIHQDALDGIILSGMQESVAKQYIDANVKDNSTKAELYRYTKNAYAQKEIDTLQISRTLFGQADKSLLEKLNNPKTPLTQSDIDSVANSLMNNPQMPEDRIGDVKEWRDGWISTFETNQKQRTAADHNPAEYKSLTDRIVTATSETEINNVLTDAVKLAASGKITDEEKKTIDSMASTFGKADFRQEQRYKSALERIKSTSFVDRIELEDAAALASKEGRIFDYFEFQKENTMRKQASDYVYSAWMTEYDKIYSANRKNWTQDQLDSFTESFVKKMNQTYGGNPNAVISTYKSYIAREVVRDNTNRLPVEKTKSNTQRLINASR